MREYNLSNIGIENPVRLHGTLSFLKVVENAPVVFLFDEEHGNLNDCIEKNIQNATELVKKGKVLLVGVESHTGGREWDRDDKCYMNYEDSDKDYTNRKISKTSMFYDALAGIFDGLVYGVECEAFSNELSLLELNNSDYATSPVNIKRSKHFIVSLFELRARKNGNGNLILNCGRDHNTHIEDWVKSGEIDDIVGSKANYLRINTID